MEALLIDLEILGDVILWSLAEDLAHLVDNLADSMYSAWNL